MCVLVFKNNFTGALFEPRMRLQQDDWENVYLLLWKESDPELDKVCVQRLPFPDTSLNLVLIK